MDACIAAKKGWDPKFDAILLENYEQFACDKEDPAYDEDTCCER